MIGDKRITYKRRHSYNTRSNKIRKLKTPGAWRAARTRRAPASLCSVRTPPGPHDLFASIPPVHLPLPKTFLLPTVSPSCRFLSGSVPAQAAR